MFSQSKKRKKNLHICVSLFARVLSRSFIIGPTEKWLKKTRLPEAYTFRMHKREISTTRASLNRREYTLKANARVYVFIVVSAITTLIQFNCPLLCKYVFEHESIRYAFCCSRVPVVPDLSLYECVRTTKWMNGIVVESTSCQNVALPGSFVIIRVTMPVCASCSPLFTHLLYVFSYITRTYICILLSAGVPHDILSIYSRVYEKSPNSLRICASELLVDHDESFVSFSGSIFISYTLGKY